ncbi:hypothetical protein CcCBS67573_g03491 [Chytriomyces confervae]|uniref:RING-type domain-containing protein n=1 Tax=Chytriomyces confervae TaxID=246404 RepID=A0A507FG55_9FUNG|nr:hypothetical protein HDU80_002198 [Chytriomyces hyalinus]TPX75223.1 hypothetical protein CcCBS67573_g03491 [Chytriomyces confervae]
MAAAIESDICSICFDPMRPRGGVPLLNLGCCGNILHFGCYQMCLLNNQCHCPMCRAPFTIFAPCNKFPPTPGVRTEAASVAFGNSLDHTITIYWSSFEGAEVRYATLLPGEGYTQETYVGHIWIARKGDDDIAGQVVGFYTVVQDKDWSVGSDS